MNDTAPDDNYKKEPRDQATASSGSSVPPAKKRARRGTKQWHKEEIENLRTRLTDHQYHLRQPGTLYEKKWRELLGNGTCYQLIGVLMRTCNWRDRRWHGNIFALAAVMGVSEKTVRNQLNKLKKLNDFEVHRHPWSITIFLPKRFFPEEKPRNEERYAEK